MNFHIDNSDKAENNKPIKISNKTIYIIGGVIAIIISIIVAIFIVMEKDVKINDDRELSKDVSSQQSLISSDNSGTESSDLPIDHSNTFIYSKSKIKSLSENQLCYDALIIDMIGKVEKSVLYEGSLDGTAPDLSDSLKNYVSKFYYNDNKTNCQKFYSSIWDGKDAAKEFCFQYMKENKINNADKFSSSDEFFNDYYEKYFTEPNYFENNKDLESELKEFVGNISRNGSEGFYNFNVKNSFANHIEDYRKFLPEGAFEYRFDNRTFKALFLMMEDNKNKTEKIKVRYFFHQKDNGAVYYDTNEEENNSKEKINYLNRFDKMNFVYFEDNISLTTSREDIKKLISMGYEWQGENILVKKVGNKTHKIIFKS